MGGCARKGPTDAVILDQGVQIPLAQSIGIAAQQFSQNAQADIASLAHGEDHRSHTVPVQPGFRSWQGGTL